MALQQLRDRPSVDVPSAPEHTVDPAVDAQRRRCRGSAGQPQRGPHWVDRTPIVWSSPAAQVGETFAAGRGLRPRPQRPDRQVGLRGSQFFIRTCLVVLIFVSGSDSSAQEFKYIALGNSITAGVGDNEFCMNEIFIPPTCGYPARLAELLDCESNDCSVLNRGQGGDKSNQAAPRLLDLLEEHTPEVVLIMYGINEVQRPVEDIVEDVHFLGTLAEAWGAEAVHASTVWRKFPPHVHDAKVAEIRDEIEAMALEEDRYFVDVWSVLCPEGLDEHGHTQDECLDIHFLPPPDPVGHPVNTGYDMLAGEFFRSLTAVPPPEAPELSFPEGVVTTHTPIFKWNRHSSQSATWFEIFIEDDQGDVLSLDVKASTICSGLACDVTPNLLLPSGSEYSWNVRGRNPAGFGAEASPLVFQIAAPPERPVPQAPGCRVSQVVEFVFFRETPAEADSYSLEVLQDGFVVFSVDFLLGELSCSQERGCTAELDPALELEEGDYTWQIRGESEFGLGDWSIAAPFTIDHDVVLSCDFESGGLGGWSNVVP